MRKAVLLSIRPAWCELIASGEKTIEVRKTRPKLETPFKCYIYCTKFHPGEPDSMINLKDRTSFFMPKGGAVIGEFLCDQLELFTVGSLGSDEIQMKSCLSYGELISYFYKQEELDGNTLKLGYGWHISELKMYNEPRKLCEFGLSRPPQSWGYVDYSMFGYEDYSNILDAIECAAKKEKAENRKMTDEEFKSILESKAQQRAARLQRENDFLNEKIKKKVFEIEKLKRKIKEMEKGATT